MLQLLRPHTTIRSPLAATREPVHHSWRKPTGPVRSAQQPNPSTAKDRKKKQLWNWHQSQPCKCQRIRPSQRPSVDRLETFHTKEVSVCTCSGVLFFKYRLIFCFSQGVYYQIGDVVSVIDEQDGKPYYAQIRGFVQDQYCEKSAALTWLIPTLASPRDQFDPASYIVGELDRDRQVLEPVYFPLLLETVFICSGRQDKIQ